MRVWKWSWFLTKSSLSSGNQNSSRHSTKPWPPSFSIRKRHLIYPIVCFSGTDCHWRIYQRNSVLVSNRSIRAAEAEFVLAATLYQSSLMSGLITPTIYIQLCHWGDYRKRPIFTPQWYLLGQETIRSRMYARCACEWEISLDDLKDSVTMFGMHSALSFSGLDSLETKSHAYRRRIAWSR